MVERGTRCTTERVQVGNSLPTAARAVFLPDECLSVAELIFTSGGESDVDLALDKLEAIRTAKAEAYWVPAQFDNLDNNEAHYVTTGPEIWEQLGGRVDALIASQGTGGWVSGV